MRSLEQMEKNWRELAKKKCKHIEGSDLYKAKFEEFVEAVLKKLKSNRHECFIDSNFFRDLQNDCEFRLALSFCYFIKVSSLAEIFFYMKTINPETKAGNYRKEEKINFGETKKVGVVVYKKWLILRKENKQTVEEYLKLEDKRHEKTI